MNFLELVKARHSVRSYKQCPVEPAKLDYILECVRLAPSAVNCQPWRFSVVTEPDKLARLKETYAREWIQNVPCIIVECGNHAEAWHRKSDGKDHTDVDVSIAVEHLCLAATEQGLGTCWVCNFDTERCRQVMQLPEELEPIALIPIGYPSEEVIAEKKRKPLDDILF